jgi:uncharacterized protein YdeI (BOF family)
MNSTFNDKQAKREAGHAARQALRAVLACALVLGASGAAFAQQHGDRDRDYAGPPPERHAERFRLPQMDRDPRQAEAQMRAFDEQRRSQQQGYPQAPYMQQPPQAQYQQPYQEQQRPRSSGRMTADERAEMRRQINEAKDFYPQRR